MEALLIGIALYATQSVLRENKTSEGVSGGCEWGGCVTRVSDVKHIGRVRDESNNDDVIWSQQEGSMCPLRSRRDGACHFGHTPRPKLRRGA